MSVWNDGVEVSPDFHEPNRADSALRLSGQDNDLALRQDIINDSDEFFLRRMGRVQIGLFRYCRQKIA